MKIEDVSQISEQIEIIPFGQIRDIHPDKQVTRYTQLPILLFFSICYQDKQLLGFIITQTNRYLDKRIHSYPSKQILRHTITQINRFQEIQLPRCIKTYSYPDKYVLGDTVTQINRFQDIQLPNCIRTYSYPEKQVLGYAGTQINRYYEHTFTQITLF